jgi:hypothetical protein
MAKYGCISWFVLIRVQDWIERGIFLYEHRPILHSKAQEIIVWELRFCSKILNVIHWTHVLMVTEYCKTSVAAKRWYVNIKCVTLYRSLVLGDIPRILHVMKTAIKLGAKKTSKNEVKAAVGWILEDGWIMYRSRRNARLHTSAPHTHTFKDGLLFDFQARKCQFWKRECHLIGLRKKKLKLLATWLRRSPLVSDRVQPMWDFTLLPLRPEDSDCNKTKHFQQTSFLKPEKRSYILNSIFSDCDLLCFATAWSYRWMSTSQSNVLPPSSGIKCVRQESAVLHIQVAKPISRSTHFNTEDGSSIFLRTVDICLKDYTETQARRPQS